MNSRTGDKNLNTLSTLVLEYLNKKENTWINGYFNTWKATFSYFKYVIEVLNKYLVQDKYLFQIEY